VCISPSPLAEKLVRTTRRLADEINAEWFAIYVNLASRPELDAVNRELPAILQDLHQITTLTNEVSHNVRFYVEGKVNRTVRFNLKVLESLAKQSGNLLQYLQEGVDRISVRLDSFRGDLTGIEGKAERELQAKLLTILKVFIVLSRSARGPLETLLSKK